MTEVKMSFDRGDKASMRFDLNDNYIKKKLKKKPKKNVKGLEAVNKNFSGKEEFDCSDNRKRNRVENGTDRRLKKQCVIAQEPNSCDLLVNADHQGLPNTYSKISAWWHLPLNPIQLATTGILKSGLDQISWEPLIGLLEDLAIKGTVAKKKVLECATEVLVKVLGEDLVDQVLLQFHQDPCKAKIVLIESLIMWYVQELAHKKIKVIQMGRNFRTETHEIPNNQDEKKGNPKKERKLPSYQKMTESFKRKQRSKRSERVPTKIFNNRVTTGKEIRKINTIKKSNIRTKEADSSISTKNASNNSSISQTIKDVLNQHNSNYSVDTRESSDEIPVEVGSGDCQTIDMVTHSPPKIKSNKRETINKNKKKTHEKDWDIIETAMETYVAERDTAPEKISPLEKSNTSLTEEMITNDIVNESDNTLKNLNEELISSKKNDLHSPTRSEISLFSRSAPDIYYTSETCPKVIRVNNADDVHSNISIELTQLKPERDENSNRKKHDLHKSSSLENDSIMLLSLNNQENISDITESESVNSSIETDKACTSSSNDITTCDYIDNELISRESQLSFNQKTELVNEPIKESIIEENIIESITDDQYKDPITSFSTFHSVLQPVVTGSETLNMESVYSNDSRVALKLSDELMLILKEQFEMKNRLSDIQSARSLPQSENSDRNISSSELRSSNSDIIRKLNFISVLSMMVLTWSILTTIHFSMEDLKIWPFESIRISINWLIDKWYR